MSLWYQSSRAFDFPMQEQGLMNPSDLKELRRAARKLQKSNTSVGSSFNQPKGPSKEQASRKCTTKLPTPSFVEGSRMNEDMVQSLLLPANILKMREANPESYRHFHLVIQV